MRSSDELNMNNSDAEVSCESSALVTFGLRNPLNNHVVGKFSVLIKDAADVG